MQLEPGPAYRRFARSTRIRSLSDRNPDSVARIFRVPTLLSFTRTRAWPFEFVFRRLPANMTLTPFIRFDLQPLQSKPETVMRNSVLLFARGRRGDTRSCR